MQLIGYCDSDFAGDKESSRSIYGYVFKFAGGLISWKSKRATTITLSMLEAETDALIKGIRKVSWIAGLFKELKQSISRLIIFYNDS